MKSLRITAIALSAVLWLWSLRLPAVVLQMTLPSSSAPGSPRVPAGLDVNTGWQMFGFSFLGFTQGNFAGLANVLLLVGWFLLWRTGRPRVVQVFTPASPQHPQGVAPAFGPPSTRIPIAARIVLGLALLLTLQTFQLHTGPIYYDEGGTKLGYLHHLLPGWYLWVLSIALPFAASLVPERQGVLPDETQRRGTQP